MPYSDDELKLLRYYNQICFTLAEDLADLSFRLNLDYNAIERISMALTQLQDSISSVNYITFDTEYLYSRPFRTIFRDKFNSFPQQLNHLNIVDSENELYDVADESEEVDPVSY